MPPYGQQRRVHRRKPGPEQWRDVAPEPGAEVPRVLVGGITPHGEGPGAHVRQHRLAPEWQQRADQDAPAHGHSRQAGGARAAERPHEHGLDLIVGVMRGEDERRPKADAGRLEPGVAGRAGEGLAGRRTQLGPAYLEGELVRHGERPYCIGHARAGGMDPVIEVRHHEIQLVKIERAMQEIEQRDRIGSARHRDERAPGRQVQRRELAPEVVEQRHAASRSGVIRYPAPRVPCARGRPA